jgi:hypothetical protein
MTPCPVDMFLISQEFVNSFGLFLDIIGAYLLFKFGLPIYLEHFARVGMYKMRLKPTEKEFKNTNDGNHKLGFLFLIAGFCLQLFSNWLPSLN